MTSLLFAVSLAAAQALRAPLAPAPAHAPVLPVLPPIAAGALFDGRAPLLADGLPPARVLRGEGGLLRRAAAYLKTLRSPRPSQAPPPPDREAGFIHERLREAFGGAAPLPGSGKAAGYIERGSGRLLNAREARETDYRPVLVVFELEAPEGGPRRIAGFFFPEPMGRRFVQPQALSNLGRAVELFNEGELGR